MRARINTIFAASFHAPLQGERRPVALEAGSKRIMFHDFIATLDH
jgi:hypothetical protein